MPRPQPHRGSRPDPASAPAFSQQAGLRGGAVPRKLGSVADLHLSQRIDQIALRPGTLFGAPFPDASQMNESDPQSPRPADREDGSRSSSPGASKPDHAGQATSGGFGAATREVMPDPRFARIHLLRHGAVRELERRVARGQLDTGLSEEGLEQERALIRCFGRESQGSAKAIERIYTSDLPRCLSLAEGLGQRLGLEPRIDPRLREQSLGDWEGRTWDELSRDNPLDISAYWTDYANARPPGGESLADVDARVRGFWIEVREQLLDRRAVFVTHVGVLRCFLARLLELPLDSALRLAPATGSHSEVLWSSAGGVLETFGERPSFGGSSMDPHP